MLTCKKKGSGMPKATQGTLDPGHSCVEHKRQNCPSGTPAEMDEKGAGNGLNQGYITN